MSFFKEFVWEFIQNLVLLTGFFISLHVWQQGNVIIGMLCAIGGGILGAWNIRWIERAHKGHDEPIRVTLTNSIVMPLLIVVFVAYLAAGWSSWQSDLALGIVAGITLSVAQRAAIKAPLDIARSLAFALAFPITLLCIRWLAANAPVISSILVSTTVVTLPIVAIHQGSKKIKTTGGS